MFDEFRRRRQQRRQAGAARRSEPWGRQRLLVMLACAGLAIVLLVAGLGLFVWYVWSDSRTETGTESQTQASVEPPGPVNVRDRIAAAPMLSVDREAAFTPDAALESAGSIRVPQARIDLGPADVPSGFPRTPEGAAGQLAAIERVVLESMSLPAAREVHQAWVRPGGPSFEQWEMTRNVRVFLTSARQAGTEKDISTLVSATPAAAMVKGIDGPSWTVVCVLMDVRAAIAVEARMGYGHCARMEWIDRRWQIGAGTVPALAPSTWPGSRLAVQAGWLTWIERG